MKRHATAFTLMELLVVMAIVGGLLALLYPVYERTVAGSRAAGCTSNLRQLGVALNAYLNENNMMMPTLQIARSSINDNVPVIDNTLNKYLPDTRAFTCPGDNQGLAAKTGTSYWWNVALNGQAISNLTFLIVKDTTHIPILADKAGFHPYLDNKVNLLYADGHVTKDVSFFTGN